MWIQKVEQGDEAPVMVLLCMMLPNLALLRVGPRLISHAFFQLYLENILSPASAGRASLVELCVEDSPLFFSDADESSEWEMCESIILACQQPPHDPDHCLHIGTGVRGLDDVPVTKQSSPMAYDCLSVNVGDNAFDIQTTKDLIGCASQLREFYCVSGDRWTPVASYVNAICDYLTIHAEDSLQILCIHGYFGPSEPREGSTGNLRGFKKLHAVELADCLLLDASCCSLTCELPKSIRSVKLYHGAYENYTVYRKMLDELLEKRPNGCRTSRPWLSAVSGACSNSCQTHTT